MKYYAKFLLAAVFCGAFCILGVAKNMNSLTLSEIVLLPAFINADYQPQYLPEITFWFLPVVFFQIFYGTYIYRHFCSASIYFFSRYCNRTVWLLKEIFHLYLFSVLYLILFLGSGVLAAWVIADVVFDTAGLLLTFYYILIHSLFLFITTVAVNILAILFTSNVGFIIIEGVSIFCIVTFTLMGQYFITSDNLVDKYTWILKLNPISHLIFGVHSSGIKCIDMLINKHAVSFDLNLSVFVFCIAALVIIVFGCIVVNKHDFIYSNKETGGI